MNLINRHVVQNAEKMLAGVNCTVGAAVQPITTLIQQAARDNGGDALDLDPKDGAFVSKSWPPPPSSPYFPSAHPPKKPNFVLITVVALLYGSWFDAANDAKIKQWTDATLASIEAEAKAKGLFHSFKFLNDAGITQDPISTYGKNGSSVGRMKAVSAKYDPNGVFQTLVPGFKLGRELHF